MVFALLFLGVTGFIFSNSAETRAESAAKSQVVAELVKPILDPQGKIPESDFIRYVRKMAHFIEFAALGFSCMGLSDGFLWKKRSLRWSLPLIVSAVIASADELSQFFSAGRGPGIKDVLLDVCGASFGVFCMWVILRLLRRKSGKKRQPPA